VNPKLSDLSVTKTQSSRWQKLAGGRALLTFWVRRRSRVQTAWIIVRPCNGLRSLSLSSDQWHLSPGAQQPRYSRRQKRAYGLLALGCWVAIAILANTRP
jgi:hypothetical protein